MLAYFRRLLRTGFAYQLGEAVAKGIALLLLPVYTRFLTPRDYGTAEVLTTGIVLVSIVVRLGIGEVGQRIRARAGDDAHPGHRGRS